MSIYVSYKLKHKLSSFLTNLFQKWLSPSTNTIFKAIKFPECNSTNITVNINSSRLNYTLPPCIPFHSSTPHPVQHCLEKKSWKRDISLNVVNFTLPYIYISISISLYISISHQIGISELIWKTGVALDLRAKFSIALVCKCWIDWV